MRPPPPLAKTLVPVRDVLLIETVLAALEKRGVSEIHAVVVNKKKQFSAHLPRLRLD